MSNEARHKAKGKRLEEQNPGEEDHRSVRQDKRGGSCKHRVGNTQKDKWLPRGAVSWGRGTRGDGDLLSMLNWVKCQKEGSMCARELGKKEGGETGAQNAITRTKREKERAH